MSDSQDEIRDLIEKYVEGLASEAEVAHLEQILKNNKQARRDYLIATQFESSMHFYADASQDDRSGTPANQPTSLFLPGLSSNSLGWIAAVAFALLISIGAFLFLRHDEDAGVIADVLCVVASEGTGNNWNLGDELSGPIEVTEGVLTVKTPGGSLISLEGPCLFEMNGLNVGTLEDGKVIVFCGESTEKLTIETNAGTYADLGTEFGVSVDRGESSLHVFDGQVFATHSDGREAEVVEGASAIQSSKDGVAAEKILADFAGFDRLRCSLSTGIVVESFEHSNISLNGPETIMPWGLSNYRMEENTEAGIENSMPLAEGLGKYLTIAGTTIAPDDKDGELSFLEAQWDYAHGQPIDVTKAHTIECVLRFNCEPSEIHDFSIYGSDKSTWKDRSWSVGAKQTNGQLMWNVFNSPQAVGTNKFQYLSINKSTTFHILVEIDPVIGKYRTTVSDGQQRIWNELYDGSPVSLQPNPLGKLFWRVRGKSGKQQLSFSIDSIQVRNRPVLGEKSDLVN